MSRAAQVLGIVATDVTFRRQIVRGLACFVGKCIHCNAKLVVALDGSTDGGVTIEHIVPRHHGGTDDPSNLALACARCNATKGVRLDARRADDPRAREVNAALLAKRAARMPGRQA
jgi:5-methylcytosine-specific restriction endonuclease McrA